MTPAEHPAPDRLRALLQGLLGAEEAVALESHLEGCAHCADVASRVEIHDDAILADLRVAVASSVSAAPSPAGGEVIGGRYRLLHLIGEGGMGAVWMAEQLEPLNRLVAIKFIRESVSSPTSLARFTFEREALARMDHPGIARVLDAGVLEHGPRRPYVVMELVEGVPITTFCNQHRLGLRDRLELMTGICQAVLHAHHKGVIHR